MVLKDAVPDEVRAKLYKLARSVEKKREERVDEDGVNGLTDDELARVLGERPGVMSRDQLMMLRDLRTQGKVGGSIVQEFGHSGKKRFSMRLAMQKNMSRQG